MSRRGQHVEGSHPTREAQAHQPAPVKRSNGDDYCRWCGALLVCRHYQKGRFYDHV